MQSLATGLFKTVAWAAIGLLLGVLVTAIWFGRVAGALTEADAILVLGAGMSPEGKLDRASALRVAAGVKLYKAGLAPVIVMSGGPARPGGPTAAGRMADLAIREGVPANAIRREGRSTSTLQNARFSAPVFAEAGAARVIVVTEGFHMARALASLQWAGISVTGAHVSTLFREGSALRMIVREALAWPYNALRILAWHIGDWRGVPESERDKWLA